MRIHAAFQPVVNVATRLLVTLNYLILIFFVIFVLLQPCHT